MALGSGDGSPSSSESYFSEETVQFARGGDSDVPDLEDPDPLPLPPRYTPATLEKTRTELYMQAKRSALLLAS